MPGIVQLPYRPSSEERRRSPGEPRSYARIIALIPLSRRLLWVISPFLASVAVLVILGSVSLDMLSAARAFVGGESLWAKGQKESVYYLNRYAQFRQIRDYELFLENIAVPLGDQNARLELDKPDPDLDVAFGGFVAGRNHPDDIPGMIRLYRRFGSVSFMARAIGIWSEADRLVADLVLLAQQLHQAIQSGTATTQDLVPLVEQVNFINRQLTPMEEQFSYTLAEAARKTEFILLMALLGSSCALIAMAITLSYRMFRRNRQVEDALRHSEERLSLAIKGSNDGFWDWNMLTDETYYSPRMSEMLDYAPGWLEPHVRSFQALLHPEDIDVVRMAMRAHFRDRAPYDVEFRLRARNGQYRWFRSHGQSVRDDNNRAIRMAGSVQDINAQRLAEAAISRHAMQQGLIASFGQMALENPEIDELMASTVHIVRQGLDVEFCRLLAADADEKTLLLKAASGWDAAWTKRLHYLAAEETADRFVIGARQAVIIDDFHNETRFGASEMLKAHNIRSGAEVLICGARGSYAVLGIYSREASQFTQESIDFLSGIANTLASAMDRKLAEERLTYMAQFDSLTSLPNRSMYLDRLWQTITQAKTGKTCVAVLFVDLDRFKLVNDTLGHSAGDAVLLQTARRLQECVQPGDTVGRLGGDEFAVTLSRLANGEEAGAVAQAIVESLSRSIVCEGQEVYVSASVGISLFPTDGHEPDTLLKNADTAMYRAKESGRSTYQFYLSQMHEHGVERLRIETQLRNALERGEFLLHYQPKVNIMTGAISGLEALLRWQSPESGLVPPAEFISILEETGMIIPVGEWVVTAVCEQLNVWRDAGLRLRPVAINLSARQFNQKDLDTVIGGIIRKTGVDASMLEFELTESMLMIDPEASVQMLRNMKNYGIRLALDDFGTGYSSLAYLKRFPLDSLKIDRAFIRDVTTDADDATITIAIINLARSLKLNVIAEGVETDAQLAFLKANACNELQGYYFARPMPAAECTVALTQDRRLIPSSFSFVNPQPIEDLDQDDEQDLVRDTLNR